MTEEVPDCSRCHERPEIGSVYDLYTAETTYYFVCRKCGRKASEDTRVKALVKWKAFNMEVSQ